MSNEGDALVRELQEEMRRERLAKLWERYGLYVVIVAAAIVLGVGGYKIWEARALAAAQAAGSKFETAMTLLEQGKTAEGIKSLETLAADGHPGYAILSKLRLAGEALEAKKPGDAVTWYEQVAKDPAADQLVRDFAALRIASLKLGEESWTDTKNRLTDIAKADRAWSYAARELIGLAAYKAGQFDEARQALAELVGDSKVPPSIVQRAQIVLGQLAAKEGASRPAPGQQDGSKATDGKVDSKVGGKK